MQNRHQKTVIRLQKWLSSLKGTGCSSRGTRLDSLHLHSRPQLAVTSALEVRALSYFSGLSGHRHVHNTQRYMHKKAPYTCEIHRHTQIDAPLFSILDASLFYSFVIKELRALSEVVGLRLWVP